MSRPLQDTPRRKRGDDFPAELYVQWGKKIRTRREALKQTQETFGQLLGIDQSTVSRLERGALAVSDGLKFRIAGALAMTVEELFPYPNTRPPFPERVPA